MAVGGGWSRLVVDGGGWYGVRFWLCLLSLFLSFQTRFCLCLWSRWHGVVFRQRGIRGSLQGAPVRRGQHLKEHAAGNEEQGKPTPGKRTRQRTVTKPVVSSSSDTSSTGALSAPSFSEFTSVSGSSSTTAFWELAAVTAAAAGVTGAALLLVLFFFFLFPFFLLVLLAGPAHYREVIISH